MSKPETKPLSVVAPWLSQYRIVSVQQMADALGYSVSHLRKLYRSGKIPGPKSIGGRKLGWPASVLVSLASEQPEQPNKAA